jgi:quinol monooxygenase YgiN
MDNSAPRIPATPAADWINRRSAIGVGVGLVAANLLSPTMAQSQEAKGQTTVSQYATSKTTIGDAVSGAGLLVVAEWEAREGQADVVAGILKQFLPEAQRDPGTKLFLIGRGRENPAQFLFYELFVDEAALQAHQDSACFKTYIAGQALPLLARRERAQYRLL